MKKILHAIQKGAIATIVLAHGILQASEAELYREIDMLKSEIKELKNTKKELSTLKKATLGDNLKLSADFRYNIDNLLYEYASGKREENKDFMTNRLIIGMKYAPRDDMVFISDLSYHKAFGDTAWHSQGNTNPGYSDFDWIINENALDNTLKVRQAYFLYLNKNNTIPWTASVGRRPSFNGYPLNLRDDEKANSPASHLINVEFDGASFKFDLDKITDIPGIYFKLCLGRGLTNAHPRFSQEPKSMPYAKDTTRHDNIDMFGFIFVPYDDGQYSVMTNVARANDVIGLRGVDIQGNLKRWSDYYDSRKNNTPIDFQGDLLAKARFSTPKFFSVGDWVGGAITLGADGIGENVSDFLDEVKVFASYAFSVTLPGHDIGMLGSTKKKFGESFYVGTQFPFGVNDGRLGIEWNRGSKYWRPVTYGEDTVIGSKLATRGYAYEIYYLQPLIGKILTMDVRLTQIEYEYTGSNAFFGDDGEPIKVGDVKDFPIPPDILQLMDPIKSARDIRLSFRYRY